jgi:hypothetical protein
MKNTKICDTSQDKFPAVIEKMSYGTHKLFLNGLICLKNEQKQF